MNVSMFDLPELFCPQRKFKLEIFSSVSPSSEMLLNPIILSDWNGSRISRRPLDLVPRAAALGVETSTLQRLA